MALRDAIGSLGFKSGDFVVTRTLVGAYDEATGIYVPGATSTFSIEASIQPTGGRSLQPGERGQRTEETRTIWTKGDVRTRVEGVCDPDKVTIDGEVWEVKDVKTWTALGGTHRVVTIARQVVA